MMERGRKEGLAEGRTKGLKEGQAKGVLEARRQAVLEALETRFGEVGERARQRVRDLADEARLSRALRLAITVASLQEFVAGL